MNTLLVTLLRIFAEAFGSARVVSMLPLLEILVMQLKLETSEDVETVAGTVVQHLQRFEAAMKAVRGQGDAANKAVRATFEVGLTKALADLGYLEVTS